MANGKNPMPKPMAKRPQSRSKKMEIELFNSHTAPPSFFPNDFTGFKRKVLLMI
jgi:hypothetical protein